MNIFLLPQLTHVPFVGPRCSSRPEKSNVATVISAHVSRRWWGRGHKTGLRCILAVGIGGHLTALVLVLDLVSSYCTPSTCRPVDLA